MITIAAILTFYASIGSLILIVGIRQWIARLSLEN